MKFTRVYDKTYNNMLVGYKFSSGFIAKDSYINYRGNEVTEGWSVETEQFGGKRLFYASTLKEAKAYVETNFER